MSENYIIIEKILNMIDRGFVLSLLMGVASAIYFITASKLLVRSREKRNARHEEQRNKITNGIRGQILNLEFS